MDQYNSDTVHSESEDSDSNVEENESDNESTNLNISKADFDPSEYYELENPHIVHVRRFKTESLQYQIRFRNTDKCDNFHEQISDILDHAVDKIISQSTYKDLVGASLNHPDLDKPVYIHFRPRANLTGEVIVHEIERILQSNVHVRIEDVASTLTVTTVSSEAGGTNTTKPRSHINFMNKKSLLKILNNDKLCCARAIVTAKAKIDNDPQWETIRKGDKSRHTLQKVRAQQLMRDAGLENHQDTCGLLELQKLQNVLHGYQIKVYNKERYCAITFVGGIPCEKVIHLYHHDEHYDVIGSVSGFFSRSYYCEACDKPYRKKGEHRCSVTCSSCYTSPACKQESLILCSTCNRYFKNEVCYNNHKKTHVSHGKKRKKRDISLCDRIQRCKDCGKHQDKAHTKIHKCGYERCRICRQEVLKIGHQCFMQPIKDISCLDETFSDVEDTNVEGKATSTDKEEKVYKFIFFDFETTQDKVQSVLKLGPILEHVPNVCIVHIVCDDCRHRELGHCGRCGENRQHFIGPNCLEQFCEFLFDDKMKNVIAIAHNAKGFDGQFILQYLFKQGIAPKVIFSGLKIMSLQIGSIKLIDSFNFLPMALSALPKTFGIEETSKGYFPHFLNTSENWNYNAEWPSAYEYGAASMKPDAYQKFMDWHLQQTGKTFNFQQEIVKYCESDVEVLRKCCLKFRDTFIEATTVDPLCQAITIAGACNLVFRKRFLKPDTIAIIPHGGYQREENQSIIATKWLKWMAEKDNCHILHKYNGGEQSVGKYRVDGLCGTTIYEFYG